MPYKFQALCAEKALPQRFPIFNWRAGFRNSFISKPDHLVTSLILSVKPLLMFIGHFGFGLAAKKLNPGPALGTCFLAAQFIDLLWPFFLV
jgi:hypothetical protein